RSRTGRAAAWLAGPEPVEGVELLHAWLTTEVYQRHRHDTYAVGVTDRGIQVFDYRGASRVSTRGQVVVLYPDEVHDGRAGTGEGFGYRIVYVQPTHLAKALRVLRGGPGPLPVVSDPGSANPRPAGAAGNASGARLDPLWADGIVVARAEALLGTERHAARPTVSRRVDVRAVERARQLLDAERTRTVHSSELETITGLT